MLLLRLCLLLLHVERENARTAHTDGGGEVFGGAAMTRTSVFDTITLRQTHTTWR